MLPAPAPESWKELILLAKNSLILGNLFEILPKHIKLEMRLYKNFGFIM